MKKNLRKIGLYVIALVYFGMAVGAFEINISPSLEPEYKTTTVPLSVIISDTYDTWKYSVNNNPNKDKKSLETY